MHSPLNTNEHMENKQLEAALFYLNRCNFSVIPAKTDKKPYLPWQEWQKQKPPESVVRKWWGEQYKFANIAIITGKVSNLTVLDVDTSEGKQKLHDLLPDTFLTPIVDTPGRGEHFYCQYREGVTNAVRFMPGCDIRSEGGYVIAPPSSDARGRWQWREGCKINEVELATMPLSVFDKIKAFSSLSSSLNSISKDYITKYIPGQQDPANILPTNVPTFANIDFTKGHRDDSLFHIANCLAKGGMPQEEIEQFLILVGMKICSPVFPQKEILEKVKSALKRSDTQERNLTQEIRNLICQHSGNITPTFCQQNLEIANIRQHRNKICTVLGRLEKEGLIKRTGNKAGEYKIIKKTFDWVDANEVQQGDYIDVRLPFFLERYVNIEPGNLIVFAGASNAGKSALMLNMIRENMRHNECWYFSSEMSRQTIRRRINKYDPSPNWNFKIVDKWDFNIDILQPDAFNFCDFLDETQGEAYRIGGMLAEIQQKMQKGIAVVAIQKKSTSEYGKGGESTINQAALYVTIDRQQYGAKLKIKKAKDFGDNNPNEWIMTFNTIKGINLVQKTSWGPEMADGKEFDK